MIPTNLLPKRMNNKNHQPNTAIPSPPASSAGTAATNPPSILNTNHTKNHSMSINTNKMSSSNNILGRINTIDNAKESSLSKTRQTIQNSIHHRNVLLQQQKQLLELHSYPNDTSRHTTVPTPGTGSTTAYPNHPLFHCRNDVSYDAELEEKEDDDDLDNDDDFDNDEIVQLYQREIQKMNEQLQQLESEYQQEDLCERRLLVQQYNYHHQKQQHQPSQQQPSQRKQSQTLERQQPKQNQQQNATSSDAMIPTSSATAPLNNKRTNTNATNDNGDTPNHTTNKKPKKAPPKPPSSNSSSKKKQTFPVRFMEIMLEIHQETLSNTDMTSVGWLPDQKSFIILDADRFLEELRHRDSTTTTSKPQKYESFLRKLNRWGFIRLGTCTITGGLDVFYHPYFRIDRPPLAQQIRQVHEMISSHQHPPPSSSSDRDTPNHPTNATTPTDGTTNHNNKNTESSDTNTANDNTTLPTATTTNQETATSPSTTNNWGGSILTTASVAGFYGTKFNDILSSKDPPSLDGIDYFVALKKKQQHQRQQRKQQH